MKILKSMVAAMLLAGALTNTSCTDYQDEIDALDFRVTTLEQLVSKYNSDIENMRVVVQAVEQGDYITGYKEEDGGYVISFHKSDPIYIKDGVDGKDAEVPDIDIKKGDDGQYYWIINGEWLESESGERIRVNGKDGKDGKDAIAPQLRINEETGIWEISTDGGKTWDSTGTKAVGKDGADGKDGNQFFMTVTYEVNEQGEFMSITTKSGQTFRIPIYKNA